MSTTIRVHTAVPRDGQPEPPPKVFTLLTRRIGEHFLPHVLEDESEIHGRVVLGVNIRAPLYVPEEELGPEMKTGFRVVSHPYRRRGNFLRKPRSEC